MKQKCVTCGHEFEGCPNCGNPTPEMEMEYSPQDSMLAKLTKPTTRMSLNDERPEDINSKYNR